MVSDVAQPVVAEIGGGFGGVAYYLLKSANTVRYIDFDLPEVILVASYYLINAFPEKRFLLFGEAQPEDPDITRDVIGSYDVIMLPNFCLPQLESESVDLFLNIHSLSEMDYETVEEYVSQIIRTCRLYFYHENSDTEKLQRGVHAEVPSSRFPIPKDVFKRIYKHKTLWKDDGSRYREHLYQRMLATSKNGTV